MSKPTRVSPYDLAAVRQGARRVVAPKSPSAMKQPYTLATSQRLMKLTVIMQAKKTS